jgi:hypothetical protein
VGRRVGLVACAVIAFATTIWPAQGSHSFGLHWARPANPFVVRVSDSLGPVWEPYLPLVTSDWSLSPVLDVTITRGGTNLLARAVCLPADGAVRVCNANHGPSGWLGITTVSSDGEHITWGTVELNDYYFLLPQYNNVQERRHALCQEIGHTLGLDHQSESGESLNTCMDYYRNTSNLDAKSTRPNAHDYEELALIYEHLDGAGGAVAAAGVRPSESVVVRHIGDETLVRYILWV